MIEKYVRSMALAVAVVAAGCDKAEPPVFTGRLFMLSGSRLIEVQPARLSSDKVVATVLNDWVGGVALSPNRRYLVFSHLKFEDRKVSESAYSRITASDVVLRDLRDGGIRTLFTSPTVVRDIDWSPDSSRFVYESAGEIRIRDLNGADRVLYQSRFERYGASARYRADDAVGVRIGGTRVHAPARQPQWAGASSIIFQRASGTFPQLIEGEGALGDRQWSDGSTRELKSLKIDTTTLVLLNDGNRAEDLELRLFVRLVCPDQACLLVGTSMFGGPIFFARSLEVPDLRTIPTFSQAATNQSYEPVVPRYMAQHGCVCALAPIEQGASKRQKGDRFNFSCVDVRSLQPRELSTKPIEGWSGDWLPHPTEMTGLQVGFATRLFDLRTGSERVLEFSSRDRSDSQIRLLGWYP